MKDKYGKKDRRKFIEALNKLYSTLKRCCGEDPISNYVEREKVLDKIERKYNKAYKKVVKYPEFWPDTEMSKRALLFLCESNVNNWPNALEVMKKCKSCDPKKVGDYLFKFFGAIERTLLEIPEDFRADSLSIMRAMRWNNRGNPVEDLAASL